MKKKTRIKKSRVFCRLVPNGHATYRGQKFEAVEDPLELLDGDVVFLPAVEVLERRLQQHALGVDGDAHTVDVP